MATLTIASPVQTDSALNYVQNVTQAGRALLAAIFVARPRAAELDVVRPASTVRGDAQADWSLYRLYCLSSPYDSVMPNLAHELRGIASRGE